MKPACARREAVVVGEDKRITVEISVGPHPMVELTAARALMVLVEELRADRVPVRHLTVCLTGPLSRPSPVPGAVGGADG